ncbi:MAG: isocitrate lyase/PEP mutase family protein, partial [Alphaproteobacteria bacterium]
EMVDNAARIVDACGLPLIADADNGYGGPLNVFRTIRAYEKAGAAAVHIEDQVFPKRCGHLAGKQLISPGDMVAKVKAAVDARIDPDFVIIARTDAIAVEGFEAALDRAGRYRAAGADVLFVEAPTSLEQLRAITQSGDAPQLYNMASSGKTPFLDMRQIEELGFRIVIYPNWMLLGAIRAAQRVLGHLKETGSIKDLRESVVTFQEFFDLLGMQEVKRLESRYISDDGARLSY